MFFSGDFFLFLYCIPFSFFSWILGHLFYYHFWVIEGNKNYIADCLVVIVNNNTKINLQNNFVNVLPSDFTYRLTPFGYEKGFTQDHYPFLISTWFEFCSLEASLAKYKYKIKLISLIILITYFFCWSYLTFNFLYAKSDDLVFLGGNGFWGSLGLTFIKRSFHTTRPLCTTPYEARHLNEKFMHYLYYSIRKVYYMAQMIYGELKSKGDYKALAMLTIIPSTPNPAIKPILVSPVRVDDSPGINMSYLWKSLCLLKQKIFLQHLLESWKL